MKNIKVHIQETQQISSQINSKRSSPKLITNCQKSQRKILKTKQKQHITQNASLIKLTVTFLKKL